MDEISTERPVNILMIEDDEHDRVVCRRALEKGRVAFQVHECHTAEDALRELRNGRQFDAVLCGIRLPGTGALAFYEKLRAEGQDIPFVVLTGAGTEQLAVRAMRAGVDDCVLTEPDELFVGMLPEVMQRVVTAYRNHAALQVAELQLRASEARFNLALEAANMGAYDWDIMTDAFHCTDRYFRLYGLAPGGSMPSLDDWLHCIHPDDRELAREEVRGGIEEHRSYKSEFRVVWPDGSIRWLASEARLIRDADGRAIRMVGVNSDITEQRIVDQQNARRRSIAAKLERLTAGERSVYELMILGKSNKVISQELNLGSRTVERRRRAIFDHFEVESLADLLHELADIRNAGRPDSLVDPGIVQP